MIFKKTTALAFAAVLFATTFSAHAMEIEESACSKTFRQKLLVKKATLDSQKKQDDADLLRVADAAKADPRSYAISLKNKADYDDKTNKMHESALMNLKYLEDGFIARKIPNCEDFLANPKHNYTEEDLKDATEEDLAEVRAELEVTIKETADELAALKSQKEANENIFKEVLSAMQQERAAAAQTWVQNLNALLGK